MIVHSVVQASTEPELLDADWERAGARPAALALELDPHTFLVVLRHEEISTIPLNVRWFTINTGNGNSKLYWIASYTFVISFIAFRIIVYGFSLLEVILHYGEIQQHMQDLAHEHGIKIWSTLIMFVLVFLGWLLQLYWFRNGILPLLFRGGKKKKKY